MQVIGITGPNGFLAWHLRCRLKMVGFDKTLLANRECFEDQSKLNEFVARSDVVVHLAGVNRSDTEEGLTSGNIDLAAKLATAISEKGSPTHVVYSNSTKSDVTGPYGEAKKAVAEILQTATAGAGGTLTDIIFPHLFGEYGQPFYNSAVHTFAHQVVTGKESRVDNDSMLELLHAQDAAEVIINSFEAFGQIRPNGKSITVSAALQKIQMLMSPYLADYTIPTLESEFDIQLFNTIKSFLPSNHYPKVLTTHSDDRGSFFEVIRSKAQGQSSISTTKSGIVRGEHFHQNKIERFAVIAGDASIQTRKLFTNEIITYHVSSETPVIVDIPTLNAHNIKNTGNTELTTLFWCHDLFDPKMPDTYNEPVNISS